MNYTLQQLRVFVKVAQCMSVTKAAEELSMTQPAVSIQLKNFQDQFAVPLTKIIGKQLRITDFGFEIYHLAERVLNEVNSINYKTRAYKGLLSGRLVVGVVSTGKYVMPFFLSDFMKQHQGIDLVMDVTNKTKVIDSLKKGDIELALVSVLPEKPDVHEEILIDNELYCVANNAFVINKSKITKEDLENHSLIYREEGSATRKVMEDYFAKKNIHVRKKLELTGNEAVKQALIAGLGISIMPLIGVRNELKQKKLKILPCAGLPVKTKWRIIWPKSRQLSPVASAYLEYLRKNKQAIIEKNFWNK